MADCKSKERSDSWSLDPNMYAITIKKVTSEGIYTTPDELKAIYTTLGTKRRPVETGKYAFEMDSKNRLHLHGTISSLDFFCLQKKGYHIHSHKLESSNDIKRWMDYIHKDAYNVYAQDQILHENYLYNHNLFL